MSTQPTPTAADRNAEAAILEEYQVGNFSRFCDDPAEFDPAPPDTIALMIARHQQPYRDAVENAQKLLEDVSDYFSKRNLGEPARLLFGRSVAALAALTAASQSPTK